MNRTRTTFLVVLLFGSCARGPEQGPTAPTTASTAATEPTQVTGAGGQGAVGDIKAGPSALEINAIRMDRQDADGKSIVRQYADPDKTYRMELGESIELWVEWDRNLGKVASGDVPQNPKLVVMWGDGDSNNIGCGGCKLYHTYKTRGLFMVKVTLDDKAGTVVSRTFWLDSRLDAPAEPTPSVSPTASPTVSPSPSPTSTPTPTPTPTPSPSPSPSVTP